MQCDPYLPTPKGQVFATDVHYANYPYSDAKYAVKIHG